jgi:hypothetical protein
MKIKLLVNGEVQELDLQEILVIKNPDAEREEAAAQVAWWGAVWAASVETAALADTEYRHWKGVSIRSLIDADPKLAEWRVSAMVESSPEWKELKTRAAAAERYANAAKAVFEAWNTKADILARLIRRDDNERYSAPATGRETTTDPRVQKMAHMNAAKRAKTQGANDGR